MPSDGIHADDTTSYSLPAPTQPMDRSGGRAADDDRLLGGRYRLMNRLGHGGMGTVWRAHDELMDREVAVKEPRIPDTVPERQRATLHERMQREARAAARISHASVITLHDVVVVENQPWLVMELVRGESLADVLETGTVDVREAARIGLAVLDGLTAAHDVGVTHRDVKPANVLLSKDGRVVLTDFGIAQMEGEQGLTDTGSLIGSPEFMAPEQALGQRPGPKSDLWALGVLLYVAVEGVSPFRRNNTAATFQAVMSAEPQRPVRAAGPLGELIVRLLDKTPAARPDAPEIRGVLRAVVTPPPLPPTRTAVMPAATGPWHVGRKMLVALVAGGLAVVLAATLLVVLRPSGDDGEETVWETREESAFQMNIAVPEGYTRSIDEDDEDHILFTSPDGIYLIEVWLRRDETRGSLQAAGAQLGHFQELSTYDEVDGDHSETEFQGREAAEMTVVTQESDFDGPLPRQQRMALFYGLEDETLMWRVQVFMPGEDGPAKTYGEELYAEVVERLELDTD
ncbi:serine/threonine-protein kinase [Streptomyces sp. MP131-18]|uniref:serine/threonine-protein kinase n=1 Tax=Streptomyces sp. MP131-18 TaxID=1857892 RepID=UPI00097C0CAF|nr:serine/threonine-protein kinase [Streptomyces sp. MP131-18]ONK10502.1 Serine/threonine-protein kinase PrkC [Streptomyces sp. MP131-18]